MGVAMEQRAEGGEERHVGCRAALAAEGLQAVAEIPVEASRLYAAGEGLEAGPRPVGRQVELRQLAAESLLPEGQELLAARAGQHPPLALDVAGVGGGERRELKGGARERGPLLQEHLERPEIGG